MSLEIKSNFRHYEVAFHENPDFIGHLKSVPNALFVIDAMVWEGHAGGALSALQNSDRVILPVSEERKSFETVQELYDQLIRRTPKKNLSLISIGGGILQDITGFAASTLYRGINWHFVPTTLLAQADSCIGAKTSLNYRGFKNLIGTFYPPFRIHIYPAFLKTQLEADYFSGVGEIAKLHLMGGENDTRDFVENLPWIAERKENILLKVIKRALLIKKSYIEEDEFDAGRRNLLNYGHCFGHALESAANFTVSHGQAVVMGMLLSNRAALKRGLLSAEKEEFFRKQVLLPVLKTRVKLDHAAVLAAMKQDKKRTGDKLALVMIKSDHSLVKVDDLEEEEAARALKECAHEID